MKKNKSSRRFKRERRFFSEDFRRARVKEIEEGQASVSEISRLYQVSSPSVYRWIKKYSVHYQKSIVKIVEEKSETKKRIALEQQVKNLHQVIGQQHLKIEYYKKLMDLIEEHYNIDIEKNFDWKSLNGFSLTDPNTK